MKKATTLLEEFTTYLRTYFPFDTLLERGAGPREDLAFNRFRVSPAKRAFMYGLRLSPWLCGLAFGFTFGTILLAQLATALGPASALAGILAPIPPFYEAYTGLIRAVNIVAVSGLIGYGTNYIAIRMLFRPVVRRPIWGQGLIPAQRDRIIFTLAQGMHKHVLNQDLIRRRVEETGLVRKLNNLLVDGSSGLILDQALRESLKSVIHQSMVDFAHRDDVRRDIREVIDTRLEENLEGGLKRFLLQTYKRYNKEDYEAAIDKVVADIPRVTLDVLGRLEKELDQLAAFIQDHKAYTEEQIMKLFVNLLNRIDITDLLAKQMAHFDEAKLERMVWEATNEQLLYIQYLGTLLGILGGLLIWRPEITGPVYLLGFGLLYGLDHLLYRFQQKRASDG